MATRYTLLWDAEEHNGRFVPTVLIADRETQSPVFQWRADYSLEMRFDALLHAFQYGETALFALNTMSLESKSV